MARPVIGIAAPFVGAGYESDRERQCAVPGAYLEALHQAGAASLLLPMPREDAGATPEETAALYAERVDGLLLIGGGDLSPVTLGEEPGPCIRGIDIARDAFETALCRAARALEIPLFGICRGAQVMNIAFGGTLIQDIPSAVDGAILHDQCGTAKSELIHSIEIERESLLYEAFARRTAYVNSFHHQACGEAGDIFEVTARAPDGVAEAIESASGSFALGVQFHPEWLLRYEEFARLFEIFADECRR